jgi:hypothetical protein
MQELPENNGGYTAIKFGKTSPQWRRRSSTNGLAEGNSSAVEKSSNVP